MLLGSISSDIHSFRSCTGKCASTVVFFLLLATALFCLPAKAKYGGGTGEPNDPYLIYDANQMNAIGADPNNWDKHFKLTADIDLSSYTGTDFNTIGYYISSIENKAFTGVFDGNGHVILNFNYTFTSDTDRVYIGLFEYVSDPNAEIRNLALIDPNIINESCWVGSLVGYLEDGMVRGCYVDGGSVWGGSTGGLVGVSGGSIINCSLSAEVHGDIFVSGLVGINDYGTITNCHSGGDVSGISQVGGGLVAGNSGTIINCYSSSTVSGLLAIGGLTGVNSGIITNCFSTGGVSGQNVLGGLVGASTGGTTEDSFWDVNTTGQTTSAGGMPKTTAEMQTQSTFTNWDFDNVWRICEGEDYPRLRWEKYDGGNGTVDDPYLIRTSCQMQAIGADPNDWDKHFKLMADVDLGGYVGEQFNVIGTGENQPFSGSFDGNGHTISNFSYISEHRSYLGLFGYVNGLNAHIKDLRLIDPNVDAGTGSAVGSLVGLLERGMISGCGVAVGSILASGPVGAFVGVNADGAIANCWCSSSVSGGQGVGGLTAVNNGTITDCYSTGGVSGVVVVGGLVGFNGSKITNCYAAGATYGGGLVGGLVAHDWDGAGTAVDSFWDVNSTGQTTSAGGIPRTTAEMQMQSTFTNWDFVSIWDICEGTNYPRLVWQIPPADFLCPDGVQMNDFGVLAAQWQQAPGEPCADIAPAGGDGIVDWLDLAVLVEHWLEGVNE